MRKPIPANSIMDPRGACERTLQNNGGHQHGACALQRRCAGDGSFAGQISLIIELIPSRAASNQRRQGSRHCHIYSKTFAGVPETPDDRRDAAGLRSDDLNTPFLAGRSVKGNCCALRTMPRSQCSNLPTCRSDLRVGAEPVGDKPEQFTAYIRKELSGRRW